MPLFIQYVTLLSAPTCYIRITLQNNSTVKTDLTYCSGGVQILLVFLKFRHSLRMVSQDLIFLLCLPLPYQSSHQSLYKLTKLMLGKTNFLCFFRVFNMSLSESQTSLYISSCLLNFLNQCLLPLKWNEITFIIEVSAVLLFLSCLLLGDSSTLCTTSPTAPARGICRLWCAAKAFRNCNLPAKKYTPVGGHEEKQSRARKQQCYFLKDRKRKCGISE